jgi:hypothetical protein
MADSDFDLHHWFAPEELEPCAACGEQAGIRLPTSGSLLCAACGHIAEGVVEPAAEHMKQPEP